VDSAAILAATAGVFLPAGFVKGVIGMGLPTVSIGLLGLLMTPIQAPAILVVPSLVTNILAGCRRRRNIQTCTADVATARRHLHGHFIRRAAATARWQRATVWLRPRAGGLCPLGLGKGQFSVPRHAETWLGLLMGTATGAITVATGIFVMPGTPYLQALAFERDKTVQALGVSFTTSTITLALALAHAGEV
jgi:hypothetical protein